MRLCTLFRRRSAIGPSSWAPPLMESEPHEIELKGGINVIITSDSFQAAAEAAEICMEWERMIDGDMEVL